MALIFQFLLCKTVVCVCVCVCMQTLTVETYKSPNFCLPETLLLFSHSVVSDSLLPHEL